MPLSFKSFYLFLSGLSLASLLLLPMESLAQIKTTQSEWWQSSTAYAMLPPTPKASVKQRVYLEKITSTAPKSYNTAYSLINIPREITEKTTNLSAIGVSKQWISLTSNDRIAKALMMMAESPEGADSLGLLHAKQGKVLFKNLAELSPQYTDFDALAWLDKHQNWMLFINEKHYNAPVPALAALIAHEAMHSDAQNSKQEEAQAWMREARTWLFFVKKYPELSDEKLNSHPLVFRLNHIAASLERDDLYRFVVEHPSYARLPETSPFFSGLVTAKAPEMDRLRTANTVPNPVTFSTPSRQRSKNLSFLSLENQLFKPTEGVRFSKASIEGSTPLKGIR